MQIRQQIVDLLLIKHLAKGRHLIPAHADDVGDAFIVRRHAAHGQILLFEQVLHAWPLPSSRRVGLMTAIAVVVVNAASRSLLGVEAELSIAFATLDVAG